MAWIQLCILIGRCKGWHWQCMYQCSSFKHLNVIWFWWKIHCNPFSQAFNQIRLLSRTKIAKLGQRRRVRLVLMDKELIEVSISLLPSDVKTAGQEVVTCHDCKLLYRFAYLLWMLPFEQCQWIFGYCVMYSRCSIVDDRKHIFLALPSSDFPDSSHNAHNRFISTIARI